MTYIRVYSGKISAGDTVLNATKQKQERISRLFQMHANKENPVDEAQAGHIYAVVGLKDTTTGDSLSAKEAPIILESMEFPEPVISVAIEPNSKGDQENCRLLFSDCLQKIRRSPFLRTKKLARPKLAVWANCTLTCWSTV